MNNTTNPYSTYVSNAQPKLDMDISDQFKVHSREEAQQQAPKIQPFTNESLTEYISQLYMTLLKIKKDINLTANEPKANKQGIKESLKIVEEIGQKITIDLPSAIDKLYL